MKMSGRTILVTGGTSGIGKALAAELLAAGNSVLITGRSEARLAEARAALPGVHTFASDQRDPAAIERLAAEAIAAFPALDMLINNAGVGPKRNLTRPAADLADLEREIRTNLIAPIQLVDRFLPQLKAQAEAAIVNVTSGLAFVPMPIKPIYCATKAALHSYTMSLRTQLKHTRVRVVELAPPATDTAFNDDEEVAINPRLLMSAEKVAQTFVAGMKKDRTEILPGFSSMLRTLGRVRPGATIRRGEAEALGG